MSPLPAWIFGSPMAPARRALSIRSAVVLQALLGLVTVLVAAERRTFVPGHLGEAQKQTTNVVNVW